MPNNDPYSSGNPYDVMKWFDPYNDEHLAAYRTLLATGMWPEGFIGEDKPLCHMWQHVLLSKLADAFLKEREN